MPKDWICCDSGKKIEKNDIGCNHDRCTGPTPVHTRNGGTWTEARFNSFIKSALRAASVRWGPKNAAKKAAWVSRGKYRCDGCRKVGPATLPPKEGNKRRINNAAVDHIDPIIDPAVGFVSWDEVVDRMFVEVDKLQVLCDKCHTNKTAEEKAIAAKRREKERS